MKTKEVALIIGESARTTMFLCEQGILGMCKKNNKNKTYIYSPAKINEWLKGGGSYESNSEQSRTEA